MIYLLTFKKMNNYNNKYLVGHNLIKKIDSILDGSLTCSNYQEYSNLKLQEFDDVNLCTVCVD